MVIRESIHLDPGSSNKPVLPLIANLTHELRTPMIGILGYVDLLEHSEINNQQSHNINALRECAEQLLDTIDSILEAAQLHNGSVALSLAPGNIISALNKAIGTYRYAMQTKGLLLETDIDHDLDTIALIDQAKLVQLMSNLISNAVKFTNRGGIKIIARLHNQGPDDNWLEVSVSDTGIGIPADLHDQVFDYFVQSDNSPSRPYGGTGMGLYICKELVRLMQGEIWVKSQEGMGSSFGYRLPIRMNPSITSETRQSGVEYSPKMESPVDFATVQVLLVEDNPLNQKLLAQMLRNYGFEVTIAANGVECLSCLQQSSIDVVLMDMQMPIMNGFEATRLIRTNPGWADLPVIAVTANSTQVDREECLACGCTSYLAKPFRSETLVQEIRTHLANRFIKEKPGSEMAQELINELLPEFMEMLDETMAELKTAIDARDWPGITNISHGLKGTAGMYGFMQISELAAQIQAAAGSMNHKLIQHLYRLTLRISQNLTQARKSQAMV